ncbi:helix-turn-helix domain-containing protein [Salibacterium lacus]|uniref:Helix-turn-helix domain-containing protein n=1 Tax=Salibacterium lacus TaxID=1898109 RepID=A0ABW5T266_9BACI
MFDRDLELKKEIASNIRRLLKENGWTQLKLSEQTGISKSTLSDYINFRTLINPGNVERLSTAFDVKKSEIDPSFKGRDSEDGSDRGDFVKEDDRSYGLNAKDERDIQKELERMINDLDDPGAYAAFDGQSIEDMGEEDKELLKDSLEHSLRIAKRAAKQKFTPNKYK